MCTMCNGNQIKDLRLSDGDYVLEVGFNYYDRHLKNMDDVLCVTILNGGNVLEAISFKQREMVVLRDHLNKMIEFKEKFDREIVNKQNPINLQSEIETLKTELEGLKELVKGKFPTARKFMVVDCGNMWSGYVICRGMVFSSETLKNEWNVSLENWDGTLEELNLKMGKEKKGSKFIKFVIVD